MSIAITGTGTSNKGAELLLLAVQQHLREAFPDARLAVTLGFGSYEDRARYGLRTVLPESPKGRWWIAGKLLPPALCDSLGAIHERDLRAVLDASGFAFSDQLGLRRVQQFACDVTRWKKQGKLVVLLPQALGPFRQPDIRRAFRSIVRKADRIYARDTLSFQFASEVAPNSEVIRQAPDFTNLVCCRSAASARPLDFDALVVPNYRMVEKTSPAEREAYTPFLARCLRELRKQGFNAAILLHDDHVDHRLIAPLESELGRRINVVRERDPVALKQSLASARLVIASRYHALVGALSQAVPCLAAGWSHKYSTLFSDYGCESSILSVRADEQEIAQAIRPLVSERGWNERHQALAAAARRQRELVRQMWKDVDGLLASALAIPQVRASQSTK